MADSPLNRRTFFSWLAGLFGLLFSELELQATSSSAAPPALHIFEVDDGEQYWWSARSAPEAYQRHWSTFWNSEAAYLAEYPDGVLVNQLADDEVLKIYVEDGPTNSGLWVKTCAEWANDHPGCCVGASVY